MAHRHAPPRAAALVESLRGLGYSTSTAIADIIDNSIAAGARTVEIDFHWAGGDSWITILDDGRGMDADGLDSAMLQRARSRYMPTKRVSRSQSALGGCRPEAVLRQTHPPEIERD